MTSDLLAIAPELWLLAGALACLGLGSWTPRRLLGRVRTLAAAVAVVHVALSVGGLVRGPTSAFHDTVVLDEVTGVLRVVVGLAVLGLVVIAGEELGTHPRSAEVHVLLLMAADGVVVLGAATDLAVLVCGFLLASMPLYGLLGLGTTETAPEATVKTYLVGALSGIVMMLGAALLFGLVGATGYHALVDGAAGAPVAGLAAGVALLLVGLLFKAGAVPVHLWVPDAVQGSTVGTAAFLTTVPKLGAVVAVARLVEHLPATGLWTGVVAVLAAVTMTVGNLAALTQDDVRRLLAWSTISQVGYLLAVAAVVDDVALAWPGLAFFVAAYAATNLACFAVVAAEPGRRTLRDWRGTGRSRPVLVAVLAVSLLGLVGTPPTAVFVAKVVALWVTWEAGLVWLAVLVAVNTLVSLGYYLRWLAACLSRPGSGEEPPAVHRAPAAAAVAVACGVTVVALGLLAGPVLAAAA